MNYVVFVYFNYYLLMDYGIYYFTYLLNYVCVRHTRLELNKSRIHVEYVAIYIFA